MSAELRNFLIALPVFALLFVVPVTTLMVDIQFDFSFSELLTDIGNTITKFGSSYSIVFSLIVAQTGAGIAAWKFLLRKSDYTHIKNPKYSM